MNSTEILFREKRWKKNFPSTSKKLSFDKYLPKSYKHLDFGCGIGIFTKLLAEKYPKTKVIGQDIDKEFITIAKTRQKLSNLKFICKKDISGKYDSISCIFMIHETLDASKTLKDVVKALDKNSKIFIIDFRKIPRESFRIWYKERKLKADFDEYYSRHNKWTVKEFEKMCQDAGLQTLKISKYGKFWLTYIGQRK